MLKIILLSKRTTAIYKNKNKTHSFEWVSFWWAQLGLNQRPLDYESSALTS